uniref:Mitochondrial GTPase 1 n=1 Tax=Clastoptera arizonana TaxID=38151 RepID=A0A1B6DW70_9HEMI
MANIKHTINAAQNFRTKFQIPDKTILHWYPGHMSKGMQKMQNTLKTVDCIIEVHDARIPFSGRNPDFIKKLTGVRPHVLVYNKIDLAGYSYIGKLRSVLKFQGEPNVLFTNSKERNCKGIQQIVPLVSDLVSSVNRFNRNEELEYRIMVIGVPNVGKSSLINAIRNKFLKRANAAAVGAIAGITKSVSTRIKISDDPLIYILDTPGILTPSVPNVEVGMRLALCATIPDGIVGIENIADYLLYWLNKHKNFSYISYLGMKEPSDNIDEVLTVGAVNYNRMVKRKNENGQYMFYPDKMSTAHNFVDAFRRGIFGNFLLDLEKLETHCKY